MRTNVQRQTSVEAWVGSMQEVNAILGVVETAFRPMREVRIAAVEEDLARLRADGHRDEFVQQRKDEGYERVADQFSVSASAVDRRAGTTHRGTFAELAQNVATRDVAELSLVYPALGYSSSKQVQLFFNKWGCRIKVESDEPVWASVMLHELVAEAKLRRPWWAATLRLPWTALLGIMLQFLIAFVVHAAARRLDIDLPWLGAYAIGLVFYMFLAWPTFSARLLPRFQLLETGQSDVAARRLGYVLTLIAGGLVALALDRLAG